MIQFETLIKGKLFYVEIQGGLSFGNMEYKETYDHFIVFNMEGSDVFLKPEAILFMVDMDFMETKLVPVGRGKSNVKKNKNGKKDSSSQKQKRSA